MTTARRQTRKRTLQGDSPGLGTFGKAVVGAGITAVVISVGLFFLAQHTRMASSD